MYSLEKGAYVVKQRKDSFVFIGTYGFVSICSMLLSVDTGSMVMSVLAVKTEFFRSEHLKGFDMILFII